MRLDKFLANNTGISRKDIKRFARNGLIELNGEVVKDVAQHMAEDDEVRLDGCAVNALGSVYLMVHKPEGYVCSTEDGENLTLLDLVGYDYGELHAAGRLDKDATGLVLLTNDGQWSHVITSPKHNHSKAYFVVLDRPVEENYGQRLAEGLMLEGEKHPTKPAQWEAIGEFSGQLTITEGRYHQVKRMFAAMGNHVVSLHRERIASIHLDQDLDPGDFRHLTPEEVDTIHE